MDKESKTKFMIEPPLAEDVEKTNGYMDANILSKLFWCFPSGILRRASKRPLGPHDIHQIYEEDKSKVVHENITREWNKQVVKSKRKNTEAIQKSIQQAQKKGGNPESVKVELSYPSFFTAIAISYGLVYLAYGCTLMIYSGTKIANVLLLRELVSHVRRKDTFDSQEAWVGLLFAIGMALCAVFQAVCHHFFFYFSMRIGAQVKAGVMSVLYTKSLGLTASAFAKTSIGHAVNILSSDTNQFEVAGPFIAYIVFAPLETIVGIYLISREIGISALFGAAVVVLMVVYQFYTSFKFASIRTLLVKFTDQRVKLLNEVLNADIIKMYAWEEPLLEKVMDERDREVKYLSQNITFKGINLASFFASVSLIHMATFAGHVARGGVMTSETTFAVIGYYNAIVFPIVQFFPFGIEKLSEVWISSRRIERFLMLGEDLYHKDQIIHPSSPPSPSPPPSGQLLNNTTHNPTAGHSPNTNTNTSGTIELTDMTQSATPSQLGSTQPPPTPPSPSPPSPPSPSLSPSPPMTYDAIRRYPVGSIRVKRATFKWPDHSSTVHTHTQRHLLELKFNARGHVYAAIEEMIETNKVAIKLQQKRDQEKQDKQHALQEQHAAAALAAGKPPRRNSFGHPGDDDIANDKLENIDLSIKPGTLTCIVGSVGSGKSSLLLALMDEMPLYNASAQYVHSHHDPIVSPTGDAMEIVIDADIETSLSDPTMDYLVPEPNPNTEGKEPQLTSPYVNGTISYAPQRAWLLAASVRDNILFGAPFDKERYIDCVYASALGRDFSLFPNGDEMYIAENGKSLSGGQRSRLCICKAIYRDADVYMFDDVLAAVDQVVADHIFHNVMGPGGILAGKTRVLVTHALAFLPFADQVVVMHEGRIVVAGTYDHVRASGWLDDDKMLTGGTTPQTHGRTTPALGTLAIKPIDSLHLDPDDEEEGDEHDDHHEEPQEQQHSNSFSVSASVVLADDQPLVTNQKDGYVNVNRVTKDVARKHLRKKLSRRRKQHQLQQHQQEPALSPIASVGSPSPSSSPTKEKHPKALGGSSPHSGDAIYPHSQEDESEGGSHSGDDVTDEGDHDNSDDSTDQDGHDQHDSDDSDDTVDAETQMNTMMNTTSTLQHPPTRDAVKQDDEDVDAQESYVHSPSFVFVDAPEYSALGITHSMSLSLLDDEHAAMANEAFSTSNIKSSSNKPATTMFQRPAETTTTTTTTATTTTATTTNLSMTLSDEAQSTQLTKHDVREIIDHVDKKKAALANIVSTEKRAEGHVSLRTYTDFIVGDRVVVFIIVIIALIAPAGLRLWADIVLSDWSSQSAAKQQNEDYTRNLFVILSSCTVFIALFRALLCMRHLLHSSTVFFQKQLFGVMFSPLSFFQANPTGRILNRLSKDQMITDELLPVTVFDFLQVTMMVISTFCIIGVVAPYILIVLVIILPLFYFLRRWYVTASRDIQRVESTSRSPIFTHFTTSMTGLAVIRAFQMEQPFIDVFNHYVDLNTRALLEFYYVSRWLGVRLDLTCALITLLAGIFSVYADIKPDLAGLILTYVSTLGSVLQWSVRQSTMVENQFAAVERILEYAYLPPEESIPAHHIKHLDSIETYQTDMLVARDDVMKKGKYLRAGTQEEFDMSPDDYIVYDYKRVGHLVTSQEDIAKILHDGLAHTLHVIDTTNEKIEALRKLVQQDEEKMMTANTSKSGSGGSSCCKSDPETTTTTATQNGQTNPPDHALEYDIETNHSEYVHLSYEEKVSQLKAELHQLRTLQPECLLTRPVGDEKDAEHVKSSTVDRILYQPPANWPHAGAISFQSVVLTYRDGLAPVLKGLSFDITPGMKVGLCGRTGAGKSSAIGVLYRLFPICYGRVMLDGIDISHVPLHTLRSALAIIPQSPFIFSDTIRYNLDPFDEHTDDEIYRVLRKVRLYSLVNSLPDRLNTLMSESGANISQGQCQLLCIGRALLKKSKVLLVDEATANIDPASDAIIQRVLQTEFHDRTVITIAHRLQTIMHCDMIMLLDSGNVMEKGSPKELLEMNGVFASMYEAQKQQEYESV